MLKRKFEASALFQGESVSGSYGGSSTINLNNSTLSSSNNFGCVEEQLAKIPNITCEKDGNEKISGTTVKDNQ